MALLVPPAGRSAAAEYFVGEFETHVTVGCGAEGLLRLEQWAAVRGLKLTHIVLARGRTPSQPMLTLGGAGTFRQHEAVAAALADDLRAAGFEPVRVKIEATPWTRGVPASDADAERLGPSVYFEHHLKVVLDPGTDREELAALVGGHAAHVSWNARRIVGAGQQQRFITQRCHGVGLKTAGERLEGLIGVVSDARFEIVSVEREFVVYDSNIAVDDGWIEDGAQR
ncbi:hypothetical protein [Kitasatospora sp. McL0602]|uniref:hypothetical protein n=1 Tax=Kitasatospora sp. McL0602 TaxID=3439530 RepID=UPI003F8C5E1E